MLQRLRQLVRSGGRALGGAPEPVQRDPDGGPLGCQATQVLLRLLYQDRRGAPQPDLADTEFRCHSQNGEDGILLYLFAVLGTTNRKAVEICAGDGIECNAANLIINHGWQGLLFDGSPANVAAGRDFYSRCKDTRFSPPALVQAWVTAENVNALVRDNGFAGEIDLLSLDLDGVDYWIWRALDCVRPRVVVLEFNAALGAGKSLTIPYSSDFRLDLSRQPYRCGASLAAFAKLGREKGYRLVGVQSLGFNAFFVRAGVGEDVLPERAPEECFAQVERLREWTPAWLEQMYEGGQQWQDV